MFLSQLLYVFMLLFLHKVVSKDNDSINLEKVWCENICAKIVCNCTSLTNVIVSNSTKLNSPQVLCVEEHFINLHWNTEGNYIYLLELINGNSSIYSHLTKYNYLTVYPLIENTLYQVRLWGAIINKNLLIKSDFIDVRTSKANENPLPVTKLSLKKLILNNNYRYDALISWTPATDFSCYYDLVWFTENSEEHYTSEEVNWEYLCQYRIRGLTLNGNYSVSITARRKNNRESPSTWLHFVTPSCLESYSSLLKCPPETPKNITLKEDFITANTSYNVIVNWLKPKFIPNFYIIHFISLIPRNNDSTRHLNISGDETSAIFYKIQDSIYYQVLITAWSSAGSSKTAYKTQHVNAISTTVSKITSKFISAYVLILIMGIIITSVIIFVGFVVVKKIFFNKNYQNNNNSQYFQNLSILNGDANNKSYVDQWEIDSNNLQLLNVLGEGEFGVVKKGVLKSRDGQIDVAVKMLKPFLLSFDTKQLKHEIEIMRNVGTHPHLVSMIGYITKGRSDEPLLIVEYCPGGNLQDYLRFLSSNPTKNFCSNPTYFNKDLVESKDLLSFGRQIALGMEYLSSIKIIHRDLAARNILLSDNKIVKVSDFGLSRDLYKNDYYKTSGGRLPLKWMALESLTNSTFTVESDVWSFGVLLWEIVTLGKSPYSGMTLQNILITLNEGRRLPQPYNCNDVLYKIMHDCWDVTPKNRPTFSELKNRLEILLEDAANYFQLNIYGIGIKYLKG